MIILNQLKERYRLIIGYTGTMTIGVGFMLLIPLITLVFYTNEINQILNFLIPSAVSIILGFLLRNFNKSKLYLLGLMLW
jgi:trk system potassium uptake protein TrkH